MTEQYAERSMPSGVGSSWVTQRPQSLTPIEEYVVVEEAEPETPTNPDD